mmetsp:Transcript_35600/g.57198  ORF Transcript_35600/g.57198 Transcript_35600/m.57198 type:complete len:615 (-) Transcript_35600:167-2011(-)
MLLIDVFLLVAPLLVASTKPNSKVCPECSDGCILTTGYDGKGPYECICPEGKQLMKDGKTCVVPAKEGCKECTYSCETQCNKTQSMSIQVGGRQYDASIGVDLADGRSTTKKCETYNRNYRGDIKFECFKGKLVHDSSQCEPICVLGPWEDVGDCSVMCGVGKAMMRRKVIQRPGPNQKPCGELTKEKVCYMPKCPEDCQVGEWKDVPNSPCSVTCGNGVKIQRREQLQPARYGGRACPSMQREVPCCVDGEGFTCGCRTGKWEDAGKCNATCGRGYILKRREVIPSWDGAECPPAEKFFPCTGDCPKVDCEMSEWKPEGACSVTCGTGTRVLRRSVITEPKNGGRLCGSERKEEECRERDCPVVQCGRVHANTECTGIPTRGVYEGVQAGPSHCRYMMEPSNDEDDETDTAKQERAMKQDVAIMVRNCSAHCDALSNCDAFNWYPEENKCCFLKAVDRLEDKQKVSCHEILQAEDDGWTGNGKYGKRTTCRPNYGSSSSSDRSYGKYHTNRHTSMHGDHSRDDDNRVSDSSLLELSIFLLFLTAIGLGSLCCIPSPGFDVDEGDNLWGRGGRSSPRRGEGGVDDDHDDNGDGPGPQSIAADIHGISGPSFHLG